MSGLKYRIIKIPNGNRQVDFIIYKCNYCGCDVPENHTYYKDQGKVACVKCGFIHGLVSEKSFLWAYGLSDAGMKVGINPETQEIEIASGKYFTWERPLKRQRHSPEYIQWRAAVFKRDNFTCQICGRVGGDLNAHHIKPFAKYKQLRTDVSNGITLCEKCHRSVHKKVGD